MSKRLTGDKGATIVEFKSHYGTTDTTVMYCVHGIPKKSCNAESCIPGPAGITISKMKVEHCHTPRADGIDKRARKKLLIASGLCVFFMVLEVVGGFLSNSLAIATDAAHLLTDFASFMISLFAIWLAGRKSTKRMSFGWHRAEVLGALVSVLMIWVITAVLVVLAIDRLKSGEFHLDPLIMLITSVIGVVVNLIMACQLHSHGHSHDSTHRQKENLNVRAAFIHVVGDFIQSFGVFIAALLIYFKPEWKIADPICTFIFSILVLITTITIIKDALLVLMEGTPSYLDYSEVYQAFSNIPGVKKVHNLRIWALSLQKVALSAHLVIEPNANPDEILQSATTMVHTKYNFYETTMQIEKYREEMEDCGQCSNPI